MPYTKATPGVLKDGRKTVTYRDDNGNIEVRIGIILGDVDENRYFTSLGNCGRRILCLGKRD